MTGIDSIKWTVYGKIKRIRKSDGSSLEYRYDASGNRVYKAYTHGGVTDKTWYVRDVQGNALAIYGNKDGGSDLYWKEQQLYGIKRFGIWEPNVIVGSDVSTIWNTLGLKRYELNNYLGNVLVTISDKPIQEGDHYIAEVLSEQDYYPFGMLQPDRQYELGSYRYGFNGKENDNEVKGAGNQQDYGFRIYDPRIGKFLSVDPLTQKYPELTPYQFASNTPIRAIDMDGLEAVIPEEESRYERDREELERKEWHRGLGYERTPEESRAKEEYEKDPESYSRNVFEALEEVFREDALQFKVKQEIKLGKTDARFASLRVQTLKTYERLNNEKASVVEANRRVSVISEGIVKNSLESNLKNDEMLLSKPRIYIGDGKNEKDFAVPDFAIYNKTTRTITKIIDAKNGGGGLSDQQERLNELGGLFKGSSRYFSPTTTPSKVAPGIVTVQNTHL